jgi:hypothetical protein
MTPFLGLLLLIALAILVVIAALIYRHPIRRPESGTRRPPDRKTRKAAPPIRTEPVLGRFAEAEAGTEQGPRRMHPHSGRVSEDTEPGRVASDAGDPRAGALRLDVAPPAEALAWLLPEHPRVVGVLDSPTAVDLARGLTTLASTVLVVTRHPDRDRAAHQQNPPPGVLIADPTALPLATGALDALLTPPPAPAEPGLRSETRRVLAPHGLCGMLETHPDTRADWIAELLAPTDVANQATPPDEGANAATVLAFGPGFATPQRTTAEWSQPMTPDALASLLAAEHPGPNPPTPETLSERIRRQHPGTGGQPLLEVPLRTHLQRAHPSSDPGHRRG